MQQSTAKIIDFSEFLQKKKDGQPAREASYSSEVPVLMWVPVWVMMPQTPLQPIN